MAGAIEEIMYYVYFLKSTKNGKYYVGTTHKKPTERLIEHNNGSNQWTRQNGPFKLAYFEEYLCKEDAAKREKFYKSGFGKLIRNAILKTVENTIGL